MIAGLLILLACEDPARSVVSSARVQINVGSDWQAAFATLPDRFGGDIQLVAGETPDLQLTVDVVADLSCVECFRLEGSGGGFTVHAADVLGAQYGVGDKTFESLRRHTFRRYPPLAIAVKPCWHCRSSSRAVAFILPASVLPADSSPVRAFAHSSASQSQRFVRPSGHRAVATASGGPRQARARRTCVATGAPSSVARSRV